MLHGRDDQGFDGSFPHLFGAPEADPLYW